MANQLTMMTDEKGRKYTPDFFIYTAAVAALTAGTSSTSQLNIFADGDFIITKTNFFVNLDGTALTASSKIVPLVNVQIMDTGSGRNWQNEALPLVNYAGEQGLPLNLPVPKIVKANANLTVTFSNISSATDYANVYLSFIGYNKLYYS